MRITRTDAELINLLMNLAGKHEGIENSEDRYRHPPYLPQVDRNLLREAATRLLTLSEWAASAPVSKQDRSPEDV